MKSLLTLLISFGLISICSGQIILNEICYDPSNSGLDGDTNGDGQYAQSEDEFLEFVNTGAEAVDLSGWKIFDTENLEDELAPVNHVIPDGTVLEAGAAIVIFGGGTPTGDFGGAIVQTSTSGDLNLNNSGDVMTLFDASDMVVLTFDIEPLSNNPNESYTRNPDLTGDFEQHEDNTPLKFSPGTKIDGSPFGSTPCAAPYPAVNSASLSSVVNSNNVVVSWDPIIGSIGCQIQGGIVGGSGLATITQLGDDLGTYTIPGGALQVGQTYQWRVRCGCSQSPLIVGPWSDFAEFSTGSASIVAAPNPTSGTTQLSFHTPSNDQVIFEVIDMSGRLVKTLYQGGVEADQEQIFQFDGSDLPNGIYLVRLSSSANVITEKLMIAR